MEPFKVLNLPVRDPFRDKKAKDEGTPIMHSKAGLDNRLSGCRLVQLMRDFPRIQF